MMTGPVSAAKWAKTVHPHHSFCSICTELARVYRHSNGDEQDRESWGVNEPPGKLAQETTTG